MDTHVEILPRWRVHMLREASGAFAVVSQEVTLLPGGLLRLYRYRGSDVITHSMTLDPRILVVAEALQQGLVRPRPIETPA